MLTNFNLVLAAMGMMLDAKGMPRGESIGARLNALRVRRGVSVRELARHSTVHPKTIAAIEAGFDVHVRSITLIASALGLRLIIRPETERFKFAVNAAHSSVHEGWTTPPGLLAQLYGVFSFDLDPCSPTRNRRRAPVIARAYLTLREDGLALSWHGSVFCNPPYGRILPKWIAKCRAEVEQRRAKTVVALIPARTDTKWWHCHVADRADAFMLRGRLKFGGSEMSAPFPSAVVIWGASATEIGRLCQVLDAWYVPRKLELAA